MTARIVIELRDDNKVYMTGPLHNKELILAMLEEAERIIKEYKPGLIVKPKDIKNIK
jgi:hypothetical protein